MKKILLLITSLLVLFTCVACGGTKKQTLYIYNWTYYTPDSVIEKFEKEYNVKVVYDNFASNEEMYAKLKAGGTGYDIVFPSGDYVSILIKEGMAERINKELIPNLQYINPGILEKATYDPQMEYSVPYYFGAAGIAVNTKKVSNFEKSWAIFSRKDLKGKMTMLDDMREVMGDALAFLGYSVNTKNPVEIEQAKELINNVWKPNLLKFDAEAFAKAFAAGEIWVAQGYAENIFAELPETEWSNVAFFIPQEGGPSYIDSMVILKGSKNLELAHKFINFIHRPEIYAEFCDTFGFPITVNMAACSYQKRTPLYNGSELLGTQLKEDLGDSLDLYNKAWEEIKIGG
ncbi:MAG TPA: extracellular solute-binding protein [Spirochaetia bacterium]|nr:extracellular solute-binding protein [Spirochaetales bacterium]HOT58770.1 extracellular solute-binding protein [Spirochaetales bacterium]HPD80007.1 extracellular solute-binding protein [Spirochaetales bacterium]HQK33566.1 extracellular solute-binding protein [Spirochaetales bacterium]HRS64521.1 extracellular solute-binding protein [Spirochaetia bacterium]